MGEGRRQQGLGPDAHAERLPIDRHMVHFSQRDARLGQAEGDRADRKTALMFDAGEPFFLHRGDQHAVLEQGGGAFTHGGQAENVHGYAVTDWGRALRKGPRLGNRSSTACSFSATALVPQVHCL